MAIPSTIAVRGWMALYWAAGRLGGAGCRGLVDRVGGVVKGCTADVVRELDGRGLGEHDSQHVGTDGRFVGC